MYKYTVAMKPEGHTLGGFINRPVQVNIVHANRKSGEGKYDKIDSVSPVHPSIDVPELDTEPFWYKWDEPEFEIWEKIPEFIQNQIREAVNVPGSPTEVMLGEAKEYDETTESLPF